MLNTLFDIKYAYHRPSDIDQWNALCLASGNLQQATIFDPVQVFYRQYPVYIEIWQGKVLAGGVKFYIYKPGILKQLTEPLGKYFQQVGELLVSNHVKSNDIIPLLNSTFHNLVDAEKPVWFRTYTYYDQPEYILSTNRKSTMEESVFCNAYVDLQKGMEELWEAIHPHHRRKIEQARKKDYQIVQSDDIGLFLKLLARTYNFQKQQGPNPAFIRHFFEVMSTEGVVKLFVSGTEKNPVSAALITSFGPVSYYAFGGSERNNDGASHLLHWEIMKQMHDQGLNKYYLGQVEAGSFSGDQKFQNGISPFKRRFGTVEVSGSKKTYILKPIHYKLWTGITKLYRG